MGKKINDVTTVLKEKVINKFTNNFNNKLINLGLTPQNSWQHLFFGKVLIFLKCKCIPDIALLWG